MIVPGLLAAVSNAMGMAEVHVALENDLVLIRSLFLS